MKHGAYALVSFSGMSTEKHDPVLKALAHIPVGEEDLSPPELVELEKLATELTSCRVVGIPHAHVHLGLEELRVGASGPMVGARGRTGESYRAPG